MSFSQPTMLALLLVSTFLLPSGCTFVSTKPEPVAPSHRTVSEYVVSDRQVNLVWQDSSSNELGFKIERKQGVEKAYREIATVGQNVTTYADTDVTKGATYYYRVRAYNVHGYSNYSKEIRVTVAGD